MTKAVRPVHEPVRIRGLEKLTGTMSLLLRYAIAVILVLIALVVRLLLETVLQDNSPFLLFFIAVVLATWLGGFRPGILATLLSVVAANFFLIEPRYTFFISETGPLIAAVLFVVEGLFLSWIVTALRAERKHAEDSAGAARESEQRLALLANASATLVASLDYAANLVNMTKLVVPTLADWCAIDLVGKEGMIRVAVASADVNQDTSAHDLQHTYVPDHAAVNGVTQALRTGKAELMTRVPDSLSATNAAEQLRLPADLPITSYIVAPMIARDRVIGVMTLVSTRPEMLYAADDLAVTEELARRAAAAVDNAWLYQEGQQLNTELEQHVQERTAALERALKDLQLFSNRLETSNRELEEFASIASHDLQEPLRKIQAFGDRLKTKAAASLNDEALDYLSRMQNSAWRMQTLINDLLAFSRVTSKGQPFTPIDLNTLVEEVLSDLEMRLEQSKGQVHVDHLPTIDGDPLQMRQLFLNLINNALKFHRNGVPPIIHVSAQILNGHPEAIGSAATEQLCRITIEDNGIGFDEKYLDRIFNVFQRLHGRSEYEGTGIGLAICRKIAERHRGTITATSVAGQGSTFFVILPLKQVVAQEA
jgi:signal transduction histidine kinase